MSDEERFEPTPQQRAWLDSLSPERRHEVSEKLHENWYQFRRMADNLDEAVDLMLPHGFGESIDNFNTNAALGAEAFRAMARGDYERANELFDAAKKYPPNLDNLEIIVIDPDKPE